jgi:hypothetical protein
MFTLAEYGKRRAVFNAVISSGGLTVKSEHVFVA